MTLNEDTFDITVSQYDYGKAVTFDADTGFETGDIIAVCFDNNALSDKEYTVNSDEYSFDLKFTEEEASAIFPVNVPLPYIIPYSIKHKREGADGFCYSLKSPSGQSLFKLKVERTVHYVD